MIIRYKWQGNFTVSEIENQISQSLNATIVNTGEMFVDIQLLPNPVSADDHADLDAFMATLGWVFDEDDPTSSLPQPSAVLLFGAEALSTTTTNRYLFPSFTLDLAATTPIQIRIPRGGTMRNMHINQTGDGNGNNLTYTLRVNNTPTALAVTLASTDNTGSDTANSVPVSAGDAIDIEVTKPSGIGNSPDDVTCTIEFV
jgi:hypothetical protein